jgi:uncharacterized protein (UPF0332 family)
MVGKGGGDGMGTWRDLAKDNRTAANELFTVKRYRSCVSRAYYAAYAEITHALLQANVTMPAGRGNPRHGALATNVEGHLTRVPLRWRLSAAIRRLYRLRIVADYVPGLALQESEARIAMGLMNEAFVCLRNVT